MSAYLCKTDIFLLTKVQYSQVYKHYFSFSSQKIYLMLDKICIISNLVRFLTSEFIVLLNIFN